jgi:hypothetical protein
MVPNLRRKYGGMKIFRIMRVKYGSKEENKSNFQENTQGIL